MALCSCRSGYTGSGYGPNGCSPLSDICELQNPCANGQCLVSAGLPTLCVVITSQGDLVRLKAECRHTTGNEAKSVRIARPKDIPGESKVSFRAHKPSFVCEVEVAILAQMT